MLERLKKLIRSDDVDERHVRTQDERVISWSGHRGMDDVSAVARFRADRVEPKVTIRVKPYRDFQKLATLDRADLDEFASFFAEVLTERNRRSGDPVPGPDEVAGASPAEWRYAIEQARDNPDHEDLMWWVDAVEDLLNEVVDDGE